MKDLGWMEAIELITHVKILFRVRVKRFYVSSDDSRKRFEKSLGGGFTTRDLTLHSFVQPCVDAYPHCISSKDETEEKQQSISAS